MHKVFLYFWVYIIYIYLVLFLDKIRHMHEYYTERNMNKTEQDMLKCWMCVQHAACTT